MTQGTGAGCQIKLANGDDCGIQAIGRCATCGHAFCPTHQAWSGQTYYRDQCAPCFAQTPAEIERVKKAKLDAEFSAALEYLNSGAARTALLANRVQPADISWVKEQWKRSLFSRDRRYFGEVIHGRGWILGEFRWDYPMVARYNHGLPIYESLGEGLGEKRDRGDWLTALLDEFIDKPWMNKAWTGLARVHHVSGGYEALNVPSDPQFHSSSDDTLANLEEFVKVAQAVKRLTGA